MKYKIYNIDKKYKEINDESIYNKMVLPQVS